MTKKHTTWQKLAVLAIALTVSTTAMADPNSDQAFTEATTLLKNYFKTGTTLIYAIGAVIGLVGAVKVYNKWNSSDGDTTKVAASWFGSCIFLVVVATFLKSFFGV